MFNANTVQNSANQKHLDLILNEKLIFNDHITSKRTTVNKITSTLRNFYHYIPRDFLVTIYKSFIRPQLHYADLANAEMRLFLIEQNQLNANVASAITGTIRVTSKEKRKSYTKNLDLKQ